MSTNEDLQKYDEAITGQKDYFTQNFGCSTSPTIYSISFNETNTHFTSCGWGWDLKCLNYSKGNPTQCGKIVLGSIAICRLCYERKKDEILDLCQKFNSHLRENYQETINRSIADKRHVGLIRWS